MVQNHNYFYQVDEIHYSFLQTYNHSQGVPRIQQWPLAIPRWHSTPHPQLSAKIIILYAVHTHRHIKSKFPNHINLSDIYEKIIQQFYCGLCVETQTVVLPWGFWNSWLTSVTVKTFPANTAHSQDVGLMSANAADVGLTSKQQWAKFSSG